MRIESSGISTVTDRKSTGAGAADKSSSPASAAVVVDLSAAASSSGDATGLSADVAARLSEVSAMLADGSYDPDFSRLAERIADEELARAGG